MSASAEIHGAKGTAVFILRMAAKASGIAESTAHQRLTFSTWQAAIEQKRAQLFEEAETKLAGTATPLDFDFSKLADDDKSTPV